MSPYLGYAVLCVLPALAFAGIERATRVWMGTAEWSALRRPAAVDGPSTAVRARRPIERCAEDLARLRDEIDRLQHSQGYARRHHLLAASMAYDDALRDTCRALDIPVPAEPLDPVERLRLEAELEVAGLSW